ncbi:hypothetical protein PVAP13_7NG358348 [Panicum virgatum]|uniref:Uncharacterized protein n=1 Tax=Panicum virgatum TaxID=38727 RepID=A0A8T0Q9C7_PANVG|nr:hypothetical protein PVAP13_7NG358348 [Panicum virgatum]
MLSTCGNVRCVCAEISSARRTGHTWRQGQRPPGRAVHGQTGSCPDPTNFGLAKRGPRGRQSVPPVHPRTASACMHAKVEQRGSHTQQHASSHMPPTTHPSWSWPHLIQTAPGSGQVRSEAAAASEDVPSALPRTSSGLKKRGAAAMTAEAAKREHGSSERHD